MALHFSLKPGSTRGVGTLHDPTIHGATRDPATRRGTKQNQTQKRHEEYYLAYNIDFEEGNQKTFISFIPDGAEITNQSMGKYHVYPQASGPPSDHIAHR